MNLHPKVQAGGIAGALAVVILAAARIAGVEVDAVEGASAATVICFLAGYFKSA